MLFRSKQINFLGKIIKIKATLSENVNLFFRIKTRIIHLFQKNKRPKDFPIIINNFNRLQYLQKQIDWLVSCGLKNIHVIDNASTYAPLLEYYKIIPATVYILDRNVGHNALWRTHLYQRFRKYYYVYTDPDLLPAQDTPKDFINHFKDLLDKYPEIQKVGFGLITNDLPDHYPRKEEVIAWEKKFTTNEIEPGVYRSKIDTTFALYRPGAFMQCWENTLRTGYPYTLHHMPWYENPSEAEVETKYYLEQATGVSSWYNSLKNSSSPYEG